ncbi:MAG: 2-iminoacetate synthase ThiH [Proteobacteria bacterium]|nr:2-iminoacetate synthase ThiH [Pseudomonadota bacterium]MBU1233654.1 2-iminoacetate synthase ThiH [Pseudomonadota bacterium]MBU1418565.1 2-iminoacetate synthase ThiH [Pseudomonadota bacterium]MBU1453953.1 2-iminoacetate synthase ThiH [Pseudomonadota bacterium]
MTDFYEYYKTWRDFPIAEHFRSVTESMVAAILQKQRLSVKDFFALLSPAAEGFLEEMAQRSHDLTIRNFGRSVLLFTPMYLSNYCSNRCVYCGFNVDNTITRHHLSFSEVETEAQEIAKSGLKHILLLTGEDKRRASIEYLSQCVRIIEKYFTAVGIEIYPLETEGYRTLVENGVDSLTLFQETYNETLYEKLHPGGPKRNYRFRLAGPERGCAAGMRAVNVGGLLGLDDWRREAFFTGLHADWLQSRWPEVAVGVSLPRMRPHAGKFQPDFPISDRHLVQVMTALRLFMPRAGVTISTREGAQFRDNILPLGVTTMSAGASTAVGGHSRQDADSTSQFDISDERNVPEMVEALKGLGYQPVYKDWQPIGASLP